jgi:hypothetical protein
MKRARASARTCHIGVLGEERLEAVLRCRWDRPFRLVANILHSRGHRGHNRDKDHQCY